MNYSDQQAWRTQQKFLPTNYRLTPDTEPVEVWWNHDGHRIHLDTYRNPSAKAKVILLHGVGTNGRQMTLIAGRPLAERGFETIAIDMPTFGMSEVATDKLVRYDDWVKIGAALVDAERAKDDRPIFLYGLSAGGMEAYHIAALNPHVAGIIGMTFLDQSSLRVRAETAFDPLSGAIGAPFIRLLASSPLRTVRVPMRYVSKMRALVNNDDALRAWYADKTSAGNSASYAFIDSYIRYQPSVAPADFATCPILLTQPADDQWSPLHLSQPFLAKISHVPVTITLLENAGHYPLEQPGLDQLAEAIAKFITQHTQTKKPS